MHRTDQQPGKLPQRVQSAGGAGSKHRLTAKRVVSSLEASAAIYSPKPLPASLRPSSASGGRGGTSGLRADALDRIRTTSGTASAAAQESLAAHRTNAAAVVLPATVFSGEPRPHETTTSLARTAPPPPPMSFVARIEAARRALSVSGTGPSSGGGGYGHTPPPPSNVTDATLNAGMKQAAERSTADHASFSPRLHVSGPVVVPPRQPDGYGGCNLMVSRPTVYGKPTATMTALDAPPAVAAPAIPPLGTPTLATIPITSSPNLLALMSRCASFRGDYSAGPASPSGLPEKATSGGAGLLLSREPVSSNDLRAQAARPWEADAGISVHVPAVGVTAAWQPPAKHPAMAAAAAAAAAAEGVDAARGSAAVKQVPTSAPPEPSPPPAATPLSTRNPPARPGTPSTRPVTPGATPGVTSTTATAAATAASAASTDPQLAEQRERELQARQRLRSLVSAASFDGSSQTDFYAFGKVIGKGSFGEVRLGWHRLAGCKVAIKCYEKSRLTDPANWRRVQQEISLMGQLNHPHIIRMLESIDTPKRVHIVMEFAGGGNLCDYVKLRGRLGEEEARGIFVQLLSAISHMHGKGVIHRDVKLENVLLTTAAVAAAATDVPSVGGGGTGGCSGEGMGAGAAAAGVTTAAGAIAGAPQSLPAARRPASAQPARGQASTIPLPRTPSPTSGSADSSAAGGGSGALIAKLVDFGFSVHVREPSKRLKVFCGTPSYMAPEITQRQEYIGGPVDVWSLAVLLYACVVGSFPFTARTYDELYKRIAASQPFFPDYLSPACCDLLRRMLNPDPLRRLTLPLILTHPWTVAAMQGGNRGASGSSAGASSSHPTGGALGRLSPGGIGINPMGPSPPFRNSKHQQLQQHQYTQQLLGQPQTDGWRGARPPPPAEQGIANLPEHSLLISADPAQDLNEAAVQKLVKMGFRRAALVDAVISRRKNSISATYYLLLSRMGRSAVAPSPVPLPGASSQQAIQPHASGAQSARGAAVDASGGLRGRGGPVIAVGAPTTGDGSSATRGSSGRLGSASGRRYSLVGTSAAGAPAAAATAAATYTAAAIGSPMPLYWGANQAQTPTGMAVAICAGASNRTGSDALPTTIAAPVGLQPRGGKSRPRSAFAASGAIVGVRISPATGAPAATAVGARATAALSTSSGDSESVVDRLLQVPSLPSMVGDAALGAPSPIRTGMRKSSFTSAGGGTAGSRMLVGLGWPGVGAEQQHRERPGTATAGGRPSAHEEAPVYRYSSFEASGLHPVGANDKGMHGHGTAGALGAATQKPPMLVPTLRGMAVRQAAFQASTAGPVFTVASSGTDRKPRPRSAAPSLSSAAAGMRR